MNIEFFKNVAEFRPEKQLKLAKVVAFNFQGTILRNSKYEVHFFLFFRPIRNEIYSRWKESLA